MTFGSDPDVTPYDTNDATPKARLLVQEGESYVRVPILNDGVTTHIRKGGPLDINRVTDAYVPREWQGEDFAQYIDAFDASKQTVYDRAEVQLYDEVTADYVTVHNGFVEAYGGVGSSEPTDPEQSDVTRRLRLLDPAVFLDVIPASQSFQGASVGAVLQYIRDEFVDAQSLWDDVEMVTRGVDTEESAGEFDPVSYAIRSLSSQGFGSLPTLRSPKTFTANRDKLSDVVAWLVQGVTATVYFTTQEEGSLALVYDESPNSRTFQASNVGGSVSVRNNNALYEISPRNALRYKGRSKSSLASVGDFELTMPSDKYPAVEVYHEPSVQRASGQKFYGRTVEGEAINLAEAEQEAKQALKERMDGASGGRIECAISPLVRPFSTIEATPACGGNLENDVQSFTYEVEEVTHKVTASDGARTDLRVAPLVSTDDMVVETSAMKAK